MTNPPTELDELRNFIERTLGFGAAVPNTTWASLLGTSEKPRGYYGSRNNYSQASLNVVTPQVWGGMHANESGIVYFDLFHQPLERLHAFLEKEMAKLGMKLVQSINPAHAARLKKIIDDTMTFMNYFLNHKAAGTRFPSAIVLRKNEDGQNWDMTVRVAIFTPNENSAFFEYTFPQLVTTVAQLITPEQVKASSDAVLDFACTAFGREKNLLPRLSMLDWSAMMLEMILQHGGELTADGFYIAYRHIVNANRAIFKEHDAVAAGRLVAWEELTVLQRRIVSDTVELARNYVNKFITYNTAAAHE